QCHPHKEVYRAYGLNVIKAALSYVKSHQQTPEAPDKPEKPEGDTEVTVSVSKVTDEVNKVTLAWGSKPNPGYRITIERIDFQDDGIAKIYYSLHYPDPDKMYIQVITEPTAETYVSSQYNAQAMPKHEASPNK